MTVEIDALDRGLARSGQTVTLRRLPAVDLAGVPALVRTNSSTELVAGLEQGESLVIVSPTQINAAGWPGTQEAGKPDIRVLNKNRGDQIIINNQVRAVQGTAKPFYIGSTLVRLEIVVK